MDTTVQDTTITPLDLNQATYEELVALPYIGEVLAQRILDYRKEHGGFSNLEELLEVQGIHQNAYEGLRGLLTVSPVQEPPVDELPPEVAFTPPEEPEAVPSPEPEAVTSPEELLHMQEATRRLTVEESVREYIVKIVRATRNHHHVELGVSPRGSMALYRAVQALAAIRGRDFVIPDDVKELAPPVLTHRILISAQTRLRGRTPEEIMIEIVEKVAVPVDEL